MGVIKSIEDILSETEELEIKLNVSKRGEEHTDFLPLTIHEIACLRDEDSMGNTGSVNGSTEFYFRVVYTLDERHQAVDIIYQEKGITARADKLSEEQVRQLINQKITAIKDKYIRQEKPKGKVQKIYEELSKKPVE